MTAFRRALVALLIVAFAPAVAPAKVGDDVNPVNGTTCSAGNETLSYDRDWGVFRYTASITCDSAYPTIWLKVRGSTINNNGKPAIALSETVSCPACSTLVRDGWRSTLPGGLFNLEVDATIVNEHGVLFKGSHDACFWVGASSAILITRGCTK